MKALFHLLSFMLVFTVFIACDDDDDQLQPAAEDLLFLNGGFSFDKAVLTPASTNPDGTFKADVYLLESPADLGTDGLTGLPADVAVLSFQALPQRGELPDGEYTVGLPRNGGNVLNTYIKDNLNSSFNDLKFMTSGTITVGTSGGQRTFSFEVRIVNDLISQYDAEAEGIPLTGSVILPLEVFN